MVSATEPIRGPFNGLVVRYQDVVGKRHEVTLEDDDPSNLATIHGIKRWAIVVIESTLCTEAGATAVGWTWLREHNAGRESTPGTL